jgi:PadR family transcriptional regulator, regulatory protein PadR
MNQDILRGHLEALILAVLEAGPAHGYAISQQLATRSDGLLSYPTGSLYPALRRLEQAGQIGACWSEVGNRQRRTYKLTTAGRRALAAQRADWQTFAAAMHKGLGLHPA